MTLIANLRDEHGDGPALHRAFAALLYRAHHGSRGSEPVAFAALPADEQARWVGRAERAVASARVAA